MSRLVLSGISRTYETARGERVAALDAVDLSVAAGELVCVVGRSGCGKTTLLRIAAGLDAPTTGTVRLDGVPIMRPTPSIGMVFQEDRLLPWRTVLDNVALGPELAGMAAGERRAIAGRFVALVGLDEFASAYPGELSGGMRQRAAIARALATKPEVILMDEPFGALDAQTRAQMQEELLRIRGLTGAAVVFVTHSIDEALVLANRVVVLSPRPGRVNGVFPVDRLRAAATGSLRMQTERQAIRSALDRA
jgi:NitT/TauT family transport system ATP-binding protein